ncbi:hypothetical protein N7532_005366 [Penicillium argentinense]|uniref:Uncharacterized protein n=1 Tax=Penicillium argentinense TaxID=1131581 RepID=A0A9W9FE15_9EURO|nr:uncharacterized protein N7532_005366 [Penicillium argentinense]KAJ5098365.1 hypothetical protein N7532_005366 [Penicillium argentinense]
MPTSRSSGPPAYSKRPSVRGSVHRRWPPPPCAEEEPASLAKELHGLSQLSENPGVEGARERGTVDQYPVILGLSISPTASPPSVPNVPGLGNVSSDDSSGPVTPSPPPPPVPEPPLRKVPGPRSQPTLQTRPPPPSDSSTSSKSRGRPQAHVHQQFGGDSQAPRQPRPRSPSRDRISKEEAPVFIAPHNSRKDVPEPTRVRGPVYERVPVNTGKPSIGRSKSARYAASVQRPVPSQRQRESSSGYLSDSATIRSKSSNPAVATAQATPPSTQSNGPTIAERLEEKLRLRQEMRERRQERREAGSLSDMETRPSVSFVKPIVTATENSLPGPASQIPPRDLDRAPAARPMERLPATRPRTTSVSSVAPPPPRSVSKTRMTGRSMSSDDAPQSTRKSSRPPPSVKFQEKHISKRSLSQSATSRQPSPPQRPSPTVGLCLIPCPRSTPVAGHKDWYTLKGLTHLDVCPSCMSQVGNSRFRDFFIPSLPKPQSQAVRCAFSNPWTRLAWAQMIKKKHDSLEMLYQMTRPPPGTRPCPGRIVTDQTWHRVVDPDTGLYLPRFHICGTCARNVRVLMPAHRDTFQHCPEPQERVCDFVTHSPRFIQFIDLLDCAASRAESDPSRRPDLREFLAYARRKVVLRDCRRDRPTMSTWHYIPSLPELTVCEDCYDEVVWPLAKKEHAIARMFSTSMHLLPGDGPNRCRDASCQLYSARMRARFRDASTKADFPGLKNIALRRFEAEQRFKDRREELLTAEKKGYDCAAEMKKAIDEWRRWE